jgi:hypothetical protein
MTAGAVATAASASSEPISERDFMILPRVDFGIGWILGACKSTAKASANQARPNRRAPEP